MYLFKPWLLNPILSLDRDDGNDNLVQDHQTRKEYTNIPCDLCDVTFRTVSHEEKPDNRKQTQSCMTCKYVFIKDKATSIFYLGKNGLTNQCQCFNDPTVD